MFGFISKKKIAPINDNITAEIWEISVSEGISAAIHGDFFKIYELYIPEWNVSFNIADKEINILSFDNLKERYNKNKTFSSYDTGAVFIKKIILSKDLTLSLHNLVDSYNLLKQNKAAVKNELDNILKK